MGGCLGKWSQLGTQQAQIRSNKTREAKYNIVHTGEETLKIKQEVTNTKTRTKTHKPWTRNRHE